MEPPAAAGGRLAADPAAAAGGTAPRRRRLRLLALHSFRTSAAIFRRQLARLGGLEGAELVFIDAPHAASGPLPDDVAAAGFEGPFLEWFTVKQARVPASRGLCWPPPLRRWP